MLKTSVHGPVIGGDITDALYKGKWGVLFQFMDDEKRYRFETVLSPEETENLIDKLNQRLEEIKEVKALQEKIT